MLHPRGAGAELRAISANASVANRTSSVEMKGPKLKRVVPPRSTVPNAAWAKGAQ
jgi:hypothetical protein